MENIVLRISRDLNLCYYVNGHGQGSRPLDGYLVGLKHSHGIYFLSMYYHVSIKTGFKLMDKWKSIHIEEEV